MSEEWTGTVWQELKDSSSQGSLTFYQDVQRKYTVHWIVSALSPVKRRKSHLLSFHSSPLAKHSSFFFLCLIILSLSLQALPESRRSIMDIPRRNIRNILEPPSDKVPSGGSSYIYSHYLPSGIPLGSKNHKFKPNQLDLFYNIPRRGYTLSVFPFLQPLGRQPTQTPCVILLNQL